LSKGKNKKPPHISGVGNVAYSEFPQLTSHMVGLSATAKQKYTPLQPTRCRAFFDFAQNAF
jgi:hypothetical protein